MMEEYDRMRLSSLIVTTAICRRHCHLRKSRLRVRILTFLLNFGANRRRISAAISQRNALGITKAITGISATVSLARVRPRGLAR